MRSIVMNMSVCSSVRSHNSKTTRPNVTTFSVHVGCGRSLFLFFRRYDTLYNSGFVDDVIFSYKGANIYSQNQV